MAQQIQTLFVDDIDGSEAEGTVRFGLDGAEYEIDLSAAHSSELRKSLEAYITNARKAGGARRSARGSGRKAAVRGIDTTAIRAWAKEQGIEIKDRGRVPANIVAQYREVTGR
jgi:nucleoid-associated protein Lsr2